MMESGELNQSIQTPNAIVGAALTCEESGIEIAHPNSSALTFPQECIVGSLGDCALTLAEGTEIPAEGIYAALLTFIGGACSGKLTFGHRFFTDTRLYTVLVGDSASSKKSSSVSQAIKNVVRELQEKDEAFKGLYISYGVGSGEGLARTLDEHHDTVLVYDELLTLMQKMKIESSSLLGIVTTLYEEHEWHNSLKEKTKTEALKDVNLSLLGCTTTQSFETLLSNSAIQLGLSNRLFIINLSSKVRVADPPCCNMQRLDEARKRLAAQLGTLPRKFEWSSQGRRLWKEWYESLPQSDATRRLDNIGLRLLPIIALITDRPEADEFVVRIVTKILNYELNIRRAFTCIESDNLAARAEQRIINALMRHGELSYSELCSKASASKCGTEIFKRCLKSLVRDGKVLESKGVTGKGNQVDRYRLPSQ